MGQSRIALRRSVRTLTVLAALSPLITTACADDRSSTTTRESTPTPARADLTRFLIRDNEEPRWERTGKPETFATASALVKSMEGPAAEEERLRDEGFEAFVSQHLEDRTGHYGGVSSVTQFATADGANRELQHLAGRPELEQELEGIKRFTVPGVPGARGFTAKKPDEHITVVVWSQGRCVLELGNGYDGPLVEPVRTGVKALYERTDGDCP